MRSANEGSGIAYLGDVEPLAPGKQAGHSKLNLLKIDKSDVPNLRKRRREKL